MKKTILIVDDEVDVIQILDFKLKEEGYETITAEDGEEALKKAKKHKPDLILLDLLMPMMDGGEVARKLRDDTKTKDIPVIILTATLAADDTKGIRLERGNMMFPKSTSFNDLVVKINQVLEERKD